MDNGPPALRITLKRRRLYKDMTTSG